MQFTLKELSNTYPTIEAFLLSEFSDVTVSYRLKEFSRAVTLAMRDFLDARSKLIKKHGKPIDDGRFQITADTTAEYDKEMQVLLEMKTADIPTLEKKLTREELKGVKITPFLLGELDFLIQ